MGPICKLVVMKVASRCNLNCDYCYMYNLADQSYLRQPRVMSTAVSEALIARAAEHSRDRSLPFFTFVFHGGEPLLAGKTFFQEFVGKAKRAFRETRPKFVVQTNGTLLTREWCELFKELGVGIGISLDGPKSTHDLHRVDHAGRGSYDAVLAGWTLAAEAGLQPGALIVIDVSTSPSEMLEFVKLLKPVMVDFLLPDATHDNPPRRPIHSSNTPYADWLIEVFDAWVSAADASLRIRTFDQIMRSVLGFDDGFDPLGTGAVEVLVIETDGEIQAADALRACHNGITRTPFNVQRHSFDQAFKHPIIDLYYNSHNALCVDCQRCELRDICGGGYLAHRYKAGLFNNPSVYCEDLKKTIGHVQRWLVGSLPESLREDLVLDPIPA